MSPAATMPMPPARTAPSSSVTTGLGMVTIWRCSATIPFAPSSMPCEPASDRSAPEQNTVPDDADHHHARLVLASARPSRSNSSVTSCRESALRLCGESRVIVATSSATS